MWKEAAKKAAEMDTVEGLAGLGWLGLRKAGSVLGSAWDGMEEFAKSLFLSEETTKTIEPINNTKDYEVVMTDAGYAKKYADGRYEFIDDVTAQADMYRDTYGGEVIQIAYKDNHSMLKNISEVRELQEDGSYKVTVYDKDGKIAQQYYEVKKLDTSKALSYEQAYRLTVGDLSFSNDELKQLGFLYGAKQDVDQYFEEIIKVANILNLQDEERLKYVADCLMDKYADKKFYNEEHLAYTYAALMENIASEFSYNGDNPIRYGFTKDVWADYPNDGYMKKTKQVDCANFAVIGLNILGLADYRAQDANLPSERYDYDDARRTAPKKPIYDDNGNKVDEYINGVTNLLYNDSLFKRIDKDDATNMDLTGLIGVMKKKDSYYDHVYVNVTSDGSKIVDSNGGGGIYSSKKESLIEKYKKRTEYYLKIKLPGWRILK